MGCIGCICLQLTNINYIKRNFGADSVDLVASFIESQLKEKVNGLMSEFGNLRVFIYKNEHVFYYTLIICKSNKKKKASLEFEEFRDFLKDKLAAIGFKIPFYWKRKMSDHGLMPSDIL